MRSELGGWVSDWNWEEVCGHDGLSIWSVEHQDLAICFQELCLQAPVLFLIAALSAYFYGKAVHRATRGQRESHLLGFRGLLTFFLALCPIARICIAVAMFPGLSTTIDYFIAAVETVTWLVHLGYILGLKYQLNVSSRGPVTLRVVWALCFILSAICLRSRILLYHSDQYPDLVPLFTLFYGFSIASVVFQCLYLCTLLPSDGSESNSATFDGHGIQNEEQQALLGGPRGTYSRFREERDPLDLGIAMESIPLLSRIFFCWVNPLMNKGAKNKLTHADDLFEMPMEMTPGYLYNQLDVAMKGETLATNTLPEHNYGSINGDAVIVTKNASCLETHKPVSLLRALHICFGTQFYGIGVLKLLADCAGFAAPLLLNKLVTFIENKSEPMQNGYFYVGGLFLVATISAFCNSHFSFLMSIVGLKIRAALITRIYRKTLTLSSSSLGKFSTGEIVNFMSTDTDRIVNSCPSFHALWSIPFQIVITLYLLYNQLGLAFLAGVGFSIILIPINKYIATKIGQLSTQLMSRKDERVKMMTEVLRGIRVLKLHVWEEHFIRKIDDLRNKELKYLRRRKYLDALCVYFWATTPVLISILTFTTYVLLGNQLTAATVFTSIALLNMLISPLNAFPWVLNGLVEAWVSLKRVDKLLELDDLDKDSYYTPIPANEPTLDILLKEATFSWTSTEEDTSVNTLSNIQMRFTKGHLIGVMGSIGSGKSSLLACILAEINRVSGFVGLVDQDIGYGFVTQQPWLQRGTVRDNILFGKAFDPTRYKQVLEACCLEEDISSLPGGDMSGIGEGGATLSGGQKARIALARAVYQDCSIYLLDDIMSAVDVHVAQIIYQLPYISSIIQVLEACCLEEDISSLPGGDMSGIGEGGATLSGGQKARIALARAVYQDCSIYLLDDIMSAVDVHVAQIIYQRCINGLLRNKTRILCTHLARYLLAADHVIVLEDGKIIRQGKPSVILSDFDDYVTSSQYDSGNKTVTNDSPDKIEKNYDTKSVGGDSILEEEEREVGTVRFDVYSSYWRAVGHVLSLVILVSMILMQTSRNLTDWWLSYWVTHISAPTNVTFPRENPLDGEIKYYLTVYGILAALNSFFTLFRAFLFAYGGLHAATNIHKILLRTVIKARPLFFDISPVGRILNRFSSDTYTIDDSLPFILNILLAQLFSVLGTLVIVIYGLPWLVLVLAPLVPVYHYLQNQYRLTSRELKRLSSITLSPVYNHFNETLLGLPTIRAFRAVPRFQRKNEANLEENQKCQFASQAAAQWLGLRLQFIGVALITGVSVIAVLQHQFDVANPGLVGLAISYSLAITGMLSGVVNAFTETEKEMIAVERCFQYIKCIESENSSQVNPPYAWPSQGVISFKDVVLKYRDHLAPSLNRVTFETRPAEKIGVVGRTGAGKSSLLSALFRLTEITKGEINIDTVNISRIGLKGLRSRLAIIPQDPFVFSGSVQENLDPLAEYREVELWEALQRCHLSAAVNKLGGLGAQLGPGGLNLSQGQRQLLCLVRAVLHNAKILCIDEATANVDQETDRHIQRTLRTSFRQSTVITIAHRVGTIMDSDRVLVMGDGEVLEFDCPDNLLQDKGSYFFKLARQEFQ